MALGSDKTLYAISAFTDDDPRVENTVTYETSLGQEVVCFPSNEFYIPSSSIKLSKLPLPVALSVRSTPRNGHDCF